MKPVVIWSLNDVEKATTLVDEPKKYTICPEPSFDMFNVNDNPSAAERASTKTSVTIRALPAGTTRSPGPSELPSPLKMVHPLYGPPLSRLAVIYTRLLALTPRCVNPGDGAGLGADHGLPEKEGHQHDRR